MTDALVSIRDLSVDFQTKDGPAHALRGASADLGRGRIIGLVGESGSGKSTLASTLLGLLPPGLRRLDGSILYDGQDLISLPPSQMRQLRGRRFAMVFQDPMGALNPVFRIGTQLADLQRAKRPKERTAERRARAAEMLARVGLGAHMEAFPHELSGGMRQRVMIAAALLAEPDLLIADEPTTALDPTVEAGIVRLLLDLRRDFSGTILFISHSLPLISNLSDDVIVMYAGTIVERAPSATLFRRPLHPYTRALIACEIGVDVRGEGPLASIPGATFPTTQVPTGCIFAERCAHVRDACRSAPPATRSLGPGHAVACIRAEDIADA